MRQDLDAAELWPVSLGAAFQDLVPERLDRQAVPRGHVRGVRLGPVGVFTASGTPQVVRRTSTAVRRSPGDLIKACVQLCGRATVHQDEHEVVLGPGQLAIYDTGRPYAIRFEGSWASAVMALPRDAIGITGHALDRSLHRVYPAGGPGGVLSHFVVSAVAQALPSVEAAAVKLGEAGSTLLAGALLDDADLIGVGTGAGTAAADGLRAHIIGYIRAHLDDPRLSRSGIAAAYHMSTRTLDRLFAAEPSSISSLIRRERLEVVRRDLADPLLRDRPVAALAARWCFFDAASFSRVFRQRYGYPPSHARSSPGQDDSAADDRAAAVPGIDLGAVLAAAGRA
jgi:AraC-like DNA-binding protein